MAVAVELGGVLMCNILLIFGIYYVFFLPEAGLWC